MKVKTLSRSVDDYIPARNTEGNRMPRNLNPSLHAFEKGREYTRALNATKLERIFAQPFIGQLGDGHIDGVYCMTNNPRSLNLIASGSGDGIIKYWDLTTREEIFSVKAHSSIVNGLTITKDNNILSCSSDMNIKLWNSCAMNDKNSIEKGENDSEEPLATYLGTSSFNSIDHHRLLPSFITASNSVELWDINRSKPTTNFVWGADTINEVKFNKTETSIFASAGSDRTIVLYDIRSNSPTQKIISSMRTNSICWNPMEAFIFAAGNEDHNTYIYDMRKMNTALNVMKDHVGAVLSVNYSPTGQELVSGSYDRTIRIYRAREGHSRDVYHTKRMQRVFSVLFTTDSRYVLSGSDDGNIRLWRARASERMGIKSARERSKIEYDDSLKERYKHMHEIRRIARHRHLPKSVKKASEIKAIEVASIKRKEENIRRTTRKRKIPYTKEREKHIQSVAFTDDSNTDVNLKEFNDDI